MEHQIPPQEDVGRIYERAGFGQAGALGTRPGVVVVDLSLGFTDPTCPTGSPIDDAVAASRRLIDVARAVDAPVAYTTIAYEPGEEERIAWLRKVPGLAVLAAGTKWVEIDPRVAPGEREPVMVKKGASAFFGTPLAEWFRDRNVDTVVICGATTSGCIRATAVDSMQNDFATVVVREAVGDRASGPHEANLFDIAAKYGEVLSIGDAVAYLEGVPVQSAR